MEITDRKEYLNSEIKKFLMDKIKEPGIFPTKIKGFNLVRREEVYEAESCFEKPLAGLVIQGIKHSIIGGYKYTYPENHIIISSIDIPISSYITLPENGKPFLFLYIYFDMELLYSLLLEIKNELKPCTKTRKSIAVGPATNDVMDMFLRLLELTTKPEQILIRSEMLIRELYYLLLISPQGSVLRCLYDTGSRNSQVARAVAWIRNNFKKRLSIEFLARYTHMSVPSFHRHFKSFTGLTPLQYQKQLRLYEARRLMFAEKENAGTAAHKVGYDSVTQFNREYKRIFGNPPLRDICLHGPKKGNGG